jgi:hypothetical protein
MPEAVNDRLTATEAAILQQVADGLRVVATPHRPGAEDREAMANRSARLEILYVLRGRDTAAPGLHGVYTGLVSD